jgi:hypothetical protein
MLTRTFKATNLIIKEPENISQNDYEKPSKRGLLGKFTPAGWSEFNLNIKRKQILFFFNKTT